MEWQEMSYNQFSSNRRFYVEPESEEEIVDFEYILIIEDLVDRLLRETDNRREYLIL